MKSSVNKSGLVIGYGNRLRGDDAIGPVIVERLALNLPAWVSALTPQQLTLDFAESISQVDLVVLVDAAVGSQPGSIQQRRIQPAESLPTLLTHHVAPEVLCRSAHVLYGRAAPMLLWTITGANFDFGAALSAPVSAAVPAVTEQILDFINALELNVTPTHHRQTSAAVRLSTHHPADQT
jgi:hydrogenase maturation protease